MTEISTCQTCGMIYDMEDSDADSPDLFCGHNCEFGNEDYDCLPGQKSKSSIEKIKRKKKPEWSEMFA